MSDPRDSEIPEGIRALWADLDADEVEVELLVAHAADPGALAPDDRARVEAYLAASPAHRDRQRVLARLAARAPEERVAALLGGAGSEPAAATAGPPPDNVVPLFRRPGAQALALAASIAVAVLAAWLVSREVEEQGLGEAPGYVQEAPVREPPRQAPEPRSAPDAPSSPEAFEPAPRLAETGAAETGAAPSSGAELDAGAEAPPERRLAVEPTPPAAEGVGAPGGDEPESPLVAGEPIELAALLEAGPPTYLAPDGSLDEARLFGVSRSAVRPVRVESLAPAHVGLTAEPSPRLYWYVSADVPAGQRFVLRAVDADEALLELRWPGPTAAGFHSVDLAVHGVELARGVEHRWLVALSHDPDDPSGDTVAAAGIRRVADPATAGPPGGTARRLAAAGLFYDALDFLSRWIERHPEEPGLRAQRAALLEQVALEAAPAADRRAAP